MRKIILILLIITFSSCIPETDKYIRQYSLKNNSNQNIRLKFYLNNQLNDEISLAQNEILYGSISEFSQPHSNDINSSAPYTFFTPNDSLIVIYDEIKKSVFTRDLDGNFSTPIDRHPFRHGNYNNIGNNNFQFTFTEDDSNNTIDCGGNCD